MVFDHSTVGTLLASSKHNKHDKHDKHDKHSKHTTTAASANGAVTAKQCAKQSWEQTRLWLQRNLSTAAAHMLRDGLWSLARTGGLDHAQWR